MLAIYAGAYLTESFRAAILVDPEGRSLEAARSIGLTGTGIALWVVLPIALRNALPSLGNNFISLFKDTSIAAVIAVPELTFQARKINNESFRVIEVWLMTSFIYVATCALIAVALRRPRNALSEVLRRRRCRAFLGVLDHVLRCAPATGFLITVAVSAAPSRQARCSASSFGLALTYGGRLARLPVPRASSTSSAARRCWSSSSPPSTCRPDFG